MNKGEGNLGLVPRIVDSNRATCVLGLESCQRGVSVPFPFGRLVGPREHLSFVVRGASMTGSAV